MAKSKKKVKQKSTPRTTARLSAPVKKSAAKAKSSKAKPEPISAEYAEYLERYELYGEGRPRLQTAEFDELDDELLDLLAIELDRGLTDEQTIRLKELEYLLLDTEQ